MTCCPVLSNAQSPRPCRLAKLASASWFRLPRARTSQRGCLYIAGIDFTSHTEPHPTTPQLNLAPSFTEFTCVAMKTIWRKKVLKNKFINNINGKDLDSRSSRPFQPFCATPYPHLQDLAKNPTLLPILRFLLPSLGCLAGASLH